MRNRVLLSARMLFEKPFDDYSLEFRASVDLDESIT